MNKPTTLTPVRENQGWLEVMLDDGQWLQIMKLTKEQIENWNWTVRNLDAVNGKI